MKPQLFSDTALDMYCYIFASLWTRVASSLGSGCIASTEYVEWCYSIRELGLGVENGNKIQYIITESHRRDYRYGNITMTRADASAGAAARIPAKHALFPLSVFFLSYSAISTFGYSRIISFFSRLMPKTLSL